MPVFDLKFINGHIVDAYGVYEADIIVEKGAIQGILKDASNVTTDRTINAKGLLIMPGVIDAHVHFWDPGYTHREDWRSGTESAAAGGVTTVLDMPSTSSPATTTVKSFKIKRNIAEKKAIIDFGLHAGVTPDTIKEIPALAKEGVASFKMFMHETIREMKKVSTADMIEIFRLLSRSRCVGTVHAEDPMVSKTKELFRKKGIKSPGTYLKSRPNVVEAIAVFTATSLAREFNVHLHIAHLSTKESIAILSNNLHSKITAETCPHYLIFTKENVKELGPYLKVTPPIKTREDREALWEGLKRNIITLVATDHCPFPKEEKEPGWKDIWKVGAGIPGVETLLPLMLTEGAKRGISYSTLVKILCNNPAKTFGLDYRKGFIKVGYDADLVLIDPKKKVRISAENMHSKCKFTPYENYITKGYPVMTVLRGKLVMEHGSILSKPGTGRYIRARLFRN